MIGSEILMALLTTLLAIFVLSFLYKHNPFFEFAEHTVVGITLGIMFYGSYRVVLTVGILPVITAAQYMLIPGLILGLMTLARLHPGYRWVSNTSLSILMGMGIGLAARGAVVGQLALQIRATILPLFTQDMLTNFSNLVIIVGAVTSTLYFTFTRKHKGPFGVATEIGRYFLMIAMGLGLCAVGISQMTAGTLASFSMWTPPGIYLTIIAGLIILADIIRSRRQAAPAKS